MMEQHFLQLVDAAERIGGPVYAVTLPLTAFNKLLAEVSTTIGLKSYPTKSGTFHLGGVVVHRGFKAVTFEFK